MKYYILILALGFFIFTSAQEKPSKKLDSLIKVQRDTVIFDQYEGKEVFFTSEKEHDKDSLQLHGNYSFKTDFTEQKFDLNRLYISGNYKDSKKEGEWLFKIQDFKIILGEITFKENSKKDTENDYNVNQDNHLKGEELNFQFFYTKNIPENEWVVEIKQVDSIVTKVEKITSINFSEGIPVGDFEFISGDKLQNKVNGSFNEGGFLDGELVIQYISKDDHKVKEVRSYYDGFLTRIITYKNDELKDSIVYQTTTDKIEQIKSSDSVNFEFSNRGFGINYDSGVKSRKQLEAQTKGNQLIQNTVDELNKFHRLGNLSKDSLQFNFTRRFKISYNQNNQSLMDELVENNEKSFDSIHTFVNNSSVILNKDKSKELSRKYAETKAFLEKLIIIDSLVGLEKESYFDFVNRDLYLENVLDTINLKYYQYFTYDSEKDSVAIDFSFEQAMKNEKPLKKINHLQDSLIKSSFQNIEETNKQFKQFAQEEKIDSLNNKILHLSKERDSLYVQGKKLDGKFEDRELSTNIYLAFNKNIISHLSKNYINNDEFEEKLKLGKDLVEVNEKIIANKSRLKRFDNFIHKTDSLFTIYRDNPFDYRDSEVRIYSNINRKSKEVLFVHYVNSLLETNKTEEFFNYLKRLKALEERLEYFVKKNDEEVQRIDRAVRRENVPQRIERIYGLQ
ncbi:MAG: hypothetical protein LAT51_00840 [Flavobacteriaceae bacterium]|nr:hypothetical protein [Flavobacteriaceae bacterium]